MPYIKSDDRVKLHPIVNELYETEDKIKTAGELNYLFTELALSYLRVNGRSYQKYNDIIGALEGCKLELYRRLVGPYEDMKIDENGDVY